MKNEIKKISKPNKVNPDLLSRKYLIGVLNFIANKTKILGWF